MATTAKTAARKATETFEGVTAGASEAVREQFDRGVAAFSEAQAFGKENIEAFVASATAAQKGLETISTRAAAYTKSAVENHVAATKSLMTSKSVQEFAEKQSAYARTAFDAYVAELTSFSELFAGVAKETIQPINERVSAVGTLMQNGVAR